jgi:hypothetical protein
MAYTPKEWESGDTVTYADMNHIETQFDEAYDYYSNHNHDDRYYTKTATYAKFFYTVNDGMGCGLDADLIYKSSGNLHAVAFEGLGIPTGLIIWWEDALIPSGWHICDGTAGTRDLRNRLMVGAGTGSNYSVGETGGSATFTASGSVSVATHVLTLSEIPAHNHGYTDHYGNYGFAGTYPSKTYLGFATTERTTGYSGSSPASAHGHESSSLSGNAISSLPFCKALYMIQKI